MLNTSSVEVPNPRQTKSKLHYLQALFVFLVFFVGVTENSLFFSPVSGIALLALAYLIRYIAKPILPPKAWISLKAIAYLLLVVSLGITPS